MEITSGGQKRTYLIDVPASYDPNHPYRVFYCSHWIGSNYNAVANGETANGGAANWGYYGLKRMATTANQPAIFIAPQSDGATWQEKDHALFDDILAYVKSSLCVDTARVFATGFSFGGMITYSLSTNHQKDIRGAVGIAPANYNIYLPADKHEPIAWMSTTGMSDGTCPWDGGGNRGAKYAAIGHAKDNGCTIPATIPTAAVGSKTHVCYDFEGCKPGYPVKVCTFDGGHQAAIADGGTADNGLTTWIATESWKFFTQF
jgi:poly(3-hydroxybutyrate) depolymerase